MRIEQGHYLLTVRMNYSAALLRGIKNHNGKEENMKVIFCKPKLSMNNTECADRFLGFCREVLDTYVAEVEYISTAYQVNQRLAAEAEANDIFIFFNNENGNYEEKFLKLVEKYISAQSRVWAIAMEKNPACRRPPHPLSDRQSFDVSCRNENRHPSQNNMRAIAQIFARKIVAQTLSPLYHDEVLYFISHRRSDGETIAAKLADGLKLLTRERNVYRDVVNVEVGNDAQKDIDRNLAFSDVLIFLQTKEAQHSDYIIKELCYALVHDIPVLWIQIDKAPYDGLSIHPGEKPMLSYQSADFECPERLTEIVDEIEANCFQLIMNTSSQVFSYVEYLNDMSSSHIIKLTNDKNATLAYEIEYKVEEADKYESGIRRHYIQCFGRNPKEADLKRFIQSVKKTGVYDRNQKMLLLSNHGGEGIQTEDDKILEENFEDYIMNLEKLLGDEKQKNGKRIILSGAFPDCDEIYKNSLLEAVLVYSREIIKNGYTLVFGAHPTFQKPIFKIGKSYASDMKESIEMHMDRKYIDGYDLRDLQEKCTLVLADGLQEMRENMISKKRSELLICLGGKIKEDKFQQGVDREVELAKAAGIPVVLVGTVGGRSSSYAFERIQTKDWSDLNALGAEFNEKMFYHVNHRLMIRQLLDRLK